MVRYVLVALILSVVSLPAASRADVFTISLEGHHPFISADDPAFAEADFDDSEWDSLAVPGKWSELGVPTSTYTGWYRLHFFVPARLPDEPLTLELGFLYWVDQTYLNGTQIGGKGFFSETSPQLHSFLPAAYRAYEIPEGLIRPGQTNVIAIRVGRHLNQGGLGGGPVRIVSGSGALMAAQVDVVRATSLNWLMLGFDFVIFILIVAAFVTGARGALLWSFCGMWATQFAFIITNMRLAYESGLQTLATAWLGIVVLGVCLFLVYDFYVRALGIGRNIIVTSICALCAAGPLLVLTARWMDWPHALSYGLDVAFQLLTPLVFLWCISCAVLAWVRGVNHAWPLAMSGLLLLVSWVQAPLLLSSDFLLQWNGFITEAAAKLIMLGAAVSLGIYLLDQSRRLAVVREKVLSAQTEERGRIARDIHDNAGQSLAAINLKLQSLQAKQARGEPVDAGDLEEALSFASVASRDLRDMSHDLAPAMTADEPLEALVRDHAQRLSEITGAQIEVVLDAPPLLDPQAKDHVYRIIQEALRNAVSHGNADRIAIVLSRQGPDLKVRIDDNGSGFDDVALTESDGFGLTSIRERTDLVSGRVTIDARQGEGSVVEVFIPAV